MPTAPLPAPYAESIRQAVRQVRAARRLSAAELATHAGVSRNAVHVLERTGAGSLSLLLAVAGALGTTPARLLARAERIWEQVPAG